MPRSLKANARPTGHVSTSCDDSGGDCSTEAATVECCRAISSQRASRARPGVISDGGALGAYRRGSGDMSGDCVRCACAEERCIPEESGFARKYDPPEPSAMPQTIATSPVYQSALGISSPDEPFTLDE